MSLYYTVKGCQFGRTLGPTQEQEGLELMTSLRLLVFFPCFDLQLPLGIHAHIHADMHTSSLSVLSAKEFVGMFPAWKAGERVKLGGPRNA